MEKKRRIGNVTAGLLIVSALLVDGLQGILTVSVFFLPLSVMVTFLATTAFGLWFLLLGVKYVGKDGKNLLIAFAAVITELAPVINALPATTVGVIGIIVRTRIEDARENLGKKKTPNTAQAQARLMRMQASRNRVASAQSERHPAANGEFEENSRQNAA